MSSKPCTLSVAQSAALRLAAALAFTLAAGCGGASSAPAPAALKGLTLSAGVLHPAFDPAVTEYSAVLAAGTLGVTVTPSAAGAITVAQDAGEPAAVASGAASAALTVPPRGGRSLVTITVAGSVPGKYTVALVQADSGDATLAALTASAGALSPAFDPATLGYTLTVPNGTTGFKVTPTAGSPAAQGITVSQDGGAAVAVASGAASAALPPPTVGGQSVVAVKVTAQDGYTTKTYSITLSQAGTADASLASLKASAGTLSPAFASATTNYTLGVPAGTSTVTLTAKSTNASVRSILLSQDGGAPLTLANGAASSALAVPAAPAQSTLVLLVTAQDGVTAARYTVLLGQGTSSDAALSSLAPAVGALFPAFSAAVTSYTLAVPYGTASLKCAVAAHDPAARSVTVSQDGAPGSAVTSGSAQVSVPAVGARSTVVFTVLAQDGRSLQTYAVALTQSPSTDASLSALAFSAGALVPAFDPAVLSYAVTVPSDAGAITLTPTARNADYRSITLSQDGGAAVSLTSGAASPGFAVPAAGAATQLKVSVTAQSGDALSYQLAVSRAAANDATLGSLSLSGAVLSPAFSPATRAYTAAAPFTGTTVTLTPTTHSPQARQIQLAVGAGAAVTVASGAASAPITLPAAGATTALTLTVLAQDGSTSLTYTVALTRQPADTDATLSALAPSAGSLSPAFAIGTLSYSLAAPFGSATIKLTPTAHASTYQSIAVSQDGGALAQVASGSPSGLLTVPALGGSSTVSVIVTAQDGTTKKTYVVTLTQAGRADAALSALTDSAGALTSFSSTTLAYAFNVPFQTGSYTVTATLHDPLASFTVNGAAGQSGQPAQVALSPGPTTVTITVTSADGSTTKSYVLTITEGGAPAGLLHARNVPVTPGALRTVASGALLPANGATEVPVDTLLRIGFDAAPTLGTAGSIKIFRSSDNQLVDSINLADPYAIYDGTSTLKKLTTNVTSSKVNVIGGLTSGIDQVRVVNYVPLYVSGNTAVIVPHNNKLAYGTQYYVTIDNGVVKGTISGGNFGGISAAGFWGFTTKAAAPATYSVADDNSADYATVQGAIDAIPAGNATSTTISIAPGVYQELLFIRSKKNLTLQGSGDGLATIIQFDNCDGFNPGTGGGQTVTTPGSGGSITAPLTGGGRAVLLMSSTTGITLDSVTLMNLHAQGSAVVPTLPTPSTVVTGQTGPTFTNYTTSITQAETIYFNTTFSVTNGIGSAGTLVAKHSNFISYQDTLQLKGFSWFYDCFVTGDTDFVWGNANTALFEHSELKSRVSNSGAAVVQSRAYLGSGTASAPASFNTSYPGFVFLSSAFTHETGTFTAYLGRSPGAPTTSGSAPVLYTQYDIVSLISCAIDGHIDPTGWNTVSGNPTGANVAPSPVTGWREYKSVTLAGAPVDTSSRRTGLVAPYGSIQLSDANVAALFKDRATIFAGATDGTYTTLGLANFSPTP